MPLRPSVGKYTTPQEARFARARPQYGPPPGVEVGLAARDRVIRHGDGYGIPGHAIEYGKRVQRVQIFNEVSRASGS